MHINLDKKRPILHHCGDSDVYAEMDMEDVRTRLFLPQHFHLDKFTEQFPTATFLLTKRPAEQWAESVSNWFDLQKRFFKVFHIHHSYPGWPKQPLIDIYNNHTQEVRQYVLDNPSHTLVEIDVEENGIADDMVRIFGGSIDCWPHTPPN